MNFNSHYRLEGQHAFLSASSHHWSNYDEAQLEKKFRTYKAAQEGTAKHELAALLIKMKQRLPRTKQTLNRYVNDALGYRMTPEQILYYSDNAFGTADTISFRGDMLRIHDYKSGSTPTKMRQLEIYEAFFCLEYRINPHEIGAELRIYQNDGVKEHVPDPVYIESLMQKIIEFDAKVDEMRMEAA